MNPCLVCGGRGWVKKSNRIDAWPIPCAACTTTLRAIARKCDVDVRTLRRIFDYKRGALSIKYTTAERFFTALCKKMPELLHHA